MKDMTHLELMLAANACLLPGKSTRAADRERLASAVAALAEDLFDSPIQRLRARAVGYLSGSVSGAELRQELMEYAAARRPDGGGRVSRRAPTTAVAASAMALDGLA